MLALLLAGCSGLASLLPHGGGRRGLWVLCEGSQRVLDEPDRVDALIDRAIALRVTDLFVQVYRGGKSWYPSQHADPSPYRAILERTGQDTLRRLIDSAHARGMRVHAWFNVLNLSGNREAPLLAAVGREAVLVDRAGRSILDYTDGDVPEPDHAYLRIETPGLWIDPAVPGVVDYLAATLDDLVRYAPDLDGLHLDFIRYPFTLPIVPGSRFDVGLDFGYGATSKARFEAEYGRAFERGESFDIFRRDLVSDLVARLRGRIPPRWEHSAAVLAFADRGYTTSMQDWRSWLEAGTLDFAVAMTYTRDDKLLYYWSHGLTGGANGDRVWLGLGSWLFTKEPQRATRQIAIAESVHPPGVVLFSYDALADQPEAIAALPWSTR